MKNLVDKLASRKFLLSAAAFLGAVGTGLTGAFTGNALFVTVGAFCGVLSAGIYAACEAYVDGKSTASSQTITQISASTTSKEVVESLTNVQAGE